MAIDKTREELAAEVETLRQDRADTLVKNVDEIAIQAAKERADLATKVAYAAGAEAARVNSRLEYLDEAIDRINGSIEKTGSSLDDLKTAMNKRFQDQINNAEITKQESRKLLFQIFGTILVATIGSATTIVVALISSGPT